MLMQHSLILHLDSIFAGLRATTVVLAISLWGCQAGGMHADLADAGAADFRQTWDAQSGDGRSPSKDLSKELSFAALFPFDGLDTMTALAIGDINLDGKPDLIIGQQAVGQEFVVLLGRGDGTFQMPSYQTLDEPFFPMAMVIRDFNGDGKPDCAFADLFGGSVRVILGHGDGSFDPAQTYATATRAGLAAADVNGDGKLDLISIANINEPNGAVSVLLGKGDGTFSVTTGATGPGMANLALADVNGDGKLDVVAPADGDFSDFGDPFNEVAVFLGKGDGTFTAAPALALPGAEYGIAVGDLNGDGKADIVADTPGMVQVFLGHGDGSFGAPRAFAVQTISLVPQLNAPISIADMDGDGQLDLVVLNPGGFGVLLGDGAGSFSAPQYFTLDFYPYSWAMAVGDVNGDGRPDVTVVGQSLNEVFLNQSH